jgi:hypothetical protein
LYCIYWSSLKYIKIWIVMFYWGLKFPHRAMILCALESDAANTSSNGHSAKKIVVLVLVWCYKARGDKEQDLWQYWLPEGWFSSGMTSLWVTVASARSVAWGRNGALTLLYLVPWASAVMCIMQTQGSEKFLINSTDQNFHWCSW